MIRLSVLYFVTDTDSGETSSDAFDVKLSSSQMSEVETVFHRLREGEPIIPRESERMHCGHCSAEHTFANVYEAAEAGWGIGGNFDGDIYCPNCR